MTRRAELLTGRNKGGEECAPTGWRWVRLGDHVTKVGSGVTPLGGHASYKRAGIPLIRSQNVHLNRFNPDGLAFISTEQDAEMETSRVQPGDVLLNITGASIGRVCVVPTEIVRQTSTSTSASFAAMGRSIPTSSPSTLRRTGFKSSFSIRRPGRRDKH